MNFLIQLIVGVILTVASTLLSQAFAPKTEKRTGTRGSTQIGGKVPQSFLVGTVGEPGKLEYQNSWGNDGEVPNAYLTNVLSFGNLPVTALSKLFVNGVAEPVSASGHVSHGYPTTGDKAGKLWVEFFDGTQTSASAYLNAKFGSDADRPWLSDMIGRGVPYLIATALWDEEVWAGFPRFMAEFKGIPLYDPRQDSTAGGAGTQRWDDPSTWAFSDNNIVIIYNIERGIYYDGKRIWGGTSTAAQLPYDVWAAAMDACDEDVTLAGGGTEKRFRAGRRIDLNERPADVIKELLIGCNGRISHASDGTVYPLVGVPAVADGAFTDADVLASEPLGSIPFPNLDEIINGATATYREPSQAWEDKETAPYYRSDLETEDDGRRQVEGLDLGTTFSGTQAQRIIKAVIEEGRRFKKHVVALPPEFAQFRPLQTLAWTSDRFDYSAKMFLITARTRDPWGNVILGLQEIDPADHDWNPATDETPLSFAPVVTNRPAPQVVSGFSVAPAIYTDTAGNSRRPAIDVFWSSTSVGQDVRAVRITIRLASDDTVVFEGEAPRPQIGSARIIQNLLPAEDYEVQIEYQPYSGRATTASSWLPVTTPDVRLGPLDIYGIDLDTLADDIKDTLGWFGGNQREVYEQLVSQAVAQGDQELANSAMFSDIRREMSQSVGDLSATFQETITTSLVPMQGQLQAVADALTEVTAADGTLVSTVRWRMTAVTGPTGYARFGAQTRVDGSDDADWRGAAWYLDTPNDDLLPTRFVVVADQFIITDLTNSEAPFVFDGGVAKMTAAKIGTVTSGRIQNAANTSYFDLDSGAFRVST